ncbi:MAG: glycosyltransferase family 2 protein [Candidatus Competibacteraceae bacterium]
MKQNKLISIVTPCFNEELNVQECYERVRAVFEKELPGYDYEHIFCDNASTDGTLEILRRIAEQDRRVKVIANARNFGPFNSMFNGLMSAGGDAAIPLVPADLQDPPEIIPRFVAEWERGHEIVYGIRSQREEGRLMHAIRRGYYHLVNRLANIDIPLNVGEFSLIDKKVVDALRQYDDYYPYLRGMIANCGFRSARVSYVWKARRKGISKNRWYSLIDQGLNGLISFTNLPMRICMFTGFLIAVFSLLYALIAFTVSLVYYRKLTEPGIPTLIVALFFFGGIQLMFLGVIGEYVSAIHSQVRKKPLVVERERINY